MVEGESLVTSLTEKLSKLDSFLEKLESYDNAEIKKMATLMHMYREHMQPNQTAADIDLVEFLDSLDGGGVPVNNGFVHFMRITDLNKQH